MNKIKQSVHFVIQQLKNAALDNFLKAEKPTDIMNRITLSKFPKMRNRINDRFPLVSYSILAYLPVPNCYHSNEAYDIRVSISSV